MNQEQDTTTPSPMHLLDSQKDRLLSKFDWVVQTLTKFYTMSARESEKESGNPDYASVTATREMVLGTIEQVAGVLYGKEDSSFISWVYPTKKEGYSDADVRGLILISSTESNRFVAKIDQNPNLILIAKDVPASKRSEWYQQLDWKPMFLPVVEDWHTEIQYQTPTTDFCKKYHLAPSFERTRYPSVVRRYGYGNVQNDSYYPEKTLEQVMHDVLSTTTLCVWANNEKISLLGFENIGPYVVCDDGIFYEYQGFVYYMASNCKSYQLAPAEGKGVQKLEFQRDSLTITYYTGIRKTASMEQADTDGGMSETWSDKYATDVKSTVIPIRNEMLKGTI